MLQTFDEDSPSYATGKKLAAEFKRGRVRTKDDLRTGCPKTSIPFYQSLEASRLCVHFLGLSPGVHFTIKKRSYNSLSETVSEVGEVELYCDILRPYI